MTSTDEIAIRILAFVFNKVAAAETNALLISGEINCGRCNCIIEIKREELLQMQMHCCCWKCVAFTDPIAFWISVYALEEVVATSLSALSSVT